MSDETEVVDLRPKKAKPGNRAAPPPAPAMEKHTAWVPIPEYEGFFALVWTNAPQQFFTDLNGADSEKTEAALRLLILEHNGWKDHEGKPFPPADDPDFYKAIPEELAICAVQAVGDSASVLPNSSRATRRQS